MADAAREAPAADREGQRQTRPETPIPVRVWIDSHRSRYQLVQGWAIAWTSRQVQVRYLDQHDRQGHTWVWANAVTRT
ncbi:hypothetical protein [Miniimonas sp. S16]|uniref:hypothetical protein n=1 Tax=Miniimonas sp. S16 TaxID=2171623 RepID=UPI00131F47AD|nr:hypothetical protein [Miniimonas sp. S16]